MQPQTNFSQWLSWVPNGVALLLFLGCLGLGWWHSYQEKRGAAQEQLARIARARTVLQGLLQGSAAAFITQAEQKYGPKTGEIKKAAVVADLLKLLPEEYRAAFDVEELGAIVESALTGCRLRLE
jgi:hypothetical protein